MTEDRGADVHRGIGSARKRRRMKRVGTHSGVSTAPRMDFVTLTADDMTYLRNVKALERKT
jgi:hypothetical protein